MSTQIINIGSKRQVTRWIPENSVEMKHAEGLGVCYVYPCREKIAVVAYRGNAGKSSFHYTYSTVEKAYEAVQNFFGGLDASKKMKAETAVQRNRPHTLKVGAIIYNSWGYDQTNVDWYQVVGVTAHFVELRKIAGNLSEQTGQMSGNSVPCVDQFIGPVEKHKATAQENGSNYVSMKYGSGCVWDGKPKYESWYA